MPTDNHAKSLLNANELLDKQDKSFQGLLLLIKSVTDTIENLKQEQHASLNAVKSLADSVKQSSDEMSGVRDNISAFDADCSKVTVLFDANLRNFGQHLEALENFSGQFSSKIPDDLTMRLAAIQKTQVHQVEHLTDLAEKLEGENSSISEKLENMDRDQSILDQVILRLDKIETFTQRFKNKKRKSIGRFSGRRDVADSSESEGSDGHK